MFATTLMDQIAAHLDFLGYETSWGEDRVLFARHPRHFNLIVKDYAFGVLFTTFFKINDKGFTRRNDVHQAVNAYNRLARVCRGYLDKDFDLVVEAYFPNYYDKGVFGSFMDTLNEDLRALADEGVGLRQFVL